YNLRQPTVFTIDLTSQNWPIENLPSQLALQLTGNTKIELDVKNQTATGPLQLNSTLALSQKPIGNIALNSNLTGKVAELKSINGNLFAGAVTGNGILRWDDILKSTGR